MVSASLWITGGSRSGKTARLVEQFCLWSRSATAHLSHLSETQTTAPPESAGTFNSANPLKTQPTVPVTLILAANGANKRDLVDRLTEASRGQYPFDATTPLGFFQAETILFWPLLIERLDLRAKFPVRLRPELEQELATELWSPELETGKLAVPGGNPVRPGSPEENRIVRRTLDLLQLAALSGTPIEDLPSILEQGQAFADIPRAAGECMTEVLLRWQDWCQQRGLLTYGIIADLYWRHLLGDRTYQRHLLDRYQFVLADDVDEYPAIARHLFEFLLDRDVVGAFTYNPWGGVRLGLGADPEYLAGLESRCQSEERPQKSGLAATLDPLWLQWPPETEARFPEMPPPTSTVRTIQTVSRAELLRRTATTIAAAVKNREVEPNQIAIVAPGLDPIARYTLREILRYEGIAVEGVAEQRPLIGSPFVRSLLVLTALVYPGSGRLLDRDAIAEMLAVLSHSPWGITPAASPSDADRFTPPPRTRPAIDPVRAGLLADRCFAPDPENPQLLPASAFPRQDRLGYRATDAYDRIRRWVANQQQQYRQNLLPSPVSLLDRAIQQFFIPRLPLPPDQLSVLRELMETAVHFWDVHSRLQPQPSGDSQPETARRFVQLLRRGVVAANPYPAKADPATRAVTLATIFQYRASRGFHRWQFWLDVGSPLWLQGGASTLWGAPLFLNAVRRRGRPWTVEETMEADRRRLQRILLDLSSRTGDRLYLCHSELAVSGQEQLGPLLPLVHATLPHLESTDF